MPDNRRWALVVGAGGYEFFNSLEYSVDDAIDFRDSLVRHLNFDSERVVLLADSETTDAQFKPTRNYIFHHLGAFSNPDSPYYLTHDFEPIGEDDLFVFYFSGHGLRTESGQQYLLPMEASNQDVTKTAVLLEEVVTGIEQLPCRHKVLFIDACRADLEGVGAKGPIENEGFGGLEVVDREGLATFYSCDPKQRSYEIKDLKHGTFTHELLQAVLHTRVNTLKELDEHLKSRVPRLNAQHGKPPQKPFCHPNPADMLELPLFRIFEEAGVNETDELVAMANALFDQKKYEDLDWWEKLTGVWEEDHAYNLELKKAILRRFYAGEMEFPEFQIRWLRSEKHIPSVRAAGPEVGIGPNGDATSEPQFKPDAN
jgi:uncharacterized caspase-like protein